MLTGVASFIAESTGGVISLLSGHLQTKKLYLDMNNKYVLLHPVLFCLYMQKQSMLQMVHSFIQDNNAIPQCIETNWIKN